MKRVFLIFPICLAFASAHSQMDNPLQKGMPITVTLSTGSVVYDINGEWDAAYYMDYFGTKKDIVKIKLLDIQQNWNFERLKKLVIFMIPARKAKAMLSGKYIYCRKALIL